MESSSLVIASKGMPLSDDWSTLTIRLLPYALPGVGVEPIRATLRVTMLRLTQDMKMVRK